MPPNQALLTWALIVQDGKIKGWKPGSSAGNDDNDDNASVVYRCVDRFFTGEAARRWRTVVYDVTITGRQRLTKHENDEIKAFKIAFRGYWDEHGVNVAMEIE